MSTSGKNTHSLSPLARSPSLSCWRYKKTLHKHTSKCLNKRKRLASWLQTSVLFFGFFLFCCFFGLRAKPWFSPLVPGEWLLQPLWLAVERSGMVHCCGVVCLNSSPGSCIKARELKQGSRCYFPGTERLSCIDQQWVCHKSVNLSPIRSPGSRCTLSFPFYFTPLPLCVCVWKRVLYLNKTRF